jgi:hypothetical protein
LCGIIGCELVFLFETACVLSAQVERSKPYTLSGAPIFTFHDDFKNTNTLQHASRAITKCKSSVKLDDSKDNRRMYDEKDFLSKNQRHVMPHEFIGDFSQPQYYYYDMRTLPTKYYVHCTTQQISGIYYNEEKNKFIGLCKRPLRNQGPIIHHIELEDDWVEENFHEEFLDLVKRKSNSEHCRFIKLPIGKAKPLSSPECNLCNPVIKYLQNGKDNCVFASMESALSYMGFTYLATLVAKYEQEFLKTQYTNDTYSSVMGLLNFKITTFKIREFNRKYQLKKIKNPDEFDLIENAKKNPTILYHVVLVGTDGSENHCVCIYNNYIFDGNYTHAWKLEQASLDECIDSTFIGICDGHMYVPIM